MYKIISLGCSVYVDEWDEFVISILLCQNCRSVWNKSRTECFYCGTENYHVYRCTKCKKLYSITNASQKCTTEECDGELIKACINDPCISNRNKRLAAYLEKFGGVFNIGNAGSTLNEMRCKKCGHKTSKFESVKAIILDQRDFENVDTVKNTLYFFRKKEDVFDAKYNTLLMKDKCMRDILAQVFRTNQEGFVEINE